MVNYLAKYLSSLRQPLRDLAKADPLIRSEEYTQILVDLRSSIVSNAPFFNNQSKNGKLIDPKSQSLTLSHLHLSNTDPKLEKDLDIYLRHMVRNLPAGDQKLVEIWTETAQGKTLSTLVKMIQEGWPSIILVPNQHPSLLERPTRAVLQELHAAHIATTKTNSEQEC
ncbi:hypothetical protein QYM36_002448 [Artemia franciscana]|uniref:Uncharacterized protein n=1 Tax=Artemia franciscana TaxID=6661 RepID=A0AA88LBB1_ARTSF|nr:hypothetical protein QYM36_002448 [Artemia franciscana]